MTGRGQLEGAWRLTACETRLGDGTLVQPFGAAPAGMLIYSPDGWMSAQLDDPKRADAHCAYWGRFSIGEGMVVHHIAGSSDARLLGDQPRRFAFTGDDGLELHGDLGDTRSRLTWRRASEERTR